MVKNVYHVITRAIAGDPVVEFESTNPRDHAALLAAATACQELGHLDLAEYFDNLAAIMREGRAKGQEKS